MINFASLIAIAAISGPMLAPESPAPVAELLATAQKQAAKEKKNVFVKFDASW